MRRSALGAPPAGALAANPELNQMLNFLRRTVAPPVVSAIVAAGRALSRRAATTSTSPSGWRATHLSAARTALVLTGDLGAAARVIMSEPIPLTPISVQKRCSIWWRSRSPTTTSPAAATSASGRRGPHSSRCAGEGDPYLPLHWSDPLAPRRFRSPRPALRGEG